jgi:V/A-type H+-transporting ATPase subunit F
MSDEIAVVGSQTFTTGFRLAGVRRFAEVAPDAASETLDAAVEDVLSEETVGIVIMHAADLDRLSRSVRERVETSVDPTVVTIGGGGGASGLRQNIKRAIGIDLMEEDS